MPAISLMIKPVSGRCNMRCKYCFYADEMARREKPLYEAMTLETLETVVRRALAYAEGVASFAFQGGEPTLAGVEFFRELVRLEKKYNSRGVRIDNSLQTNGLRLDDELIELFAKERFLLGVSVDGEGETHDAMRVDARGEGTFHRVMENVARLKERGVEYNILCVVNKGVARRPRETFAALEGSGFIQFIPCLDGFDGKKSEHSLTDGDYLYFLKETFDRYYERFMSGKYVSVRTFDNYVGALMGREMESCALKGRCGNYFLIEAGGEVFPCDFYALDEWRLGNILEESFFKLEKSPVSRDFRERSLALDAACRECKWFFLCRGGCPRERAGVGGRYRFCAASAAFFEYSLPRMKEIAARIAQI